LAAGEPDTEVKRAKSAVFQRSFPCLPHKIGEKIFPIAMRVVLVSDSAPVRKLCRVLLEEGYGRKLQLFEETHASAGLEICRRVSPDCVLIEDKLPDNNGLGFLKQLRAQEDPVPSIAAILLIRPTGEALARSALQAGAQDYLSRDRITVDSLKHAIDRATQAIEIDRRLRQKKEQLAQSLAEKEVLVKEVHHRVKNNLQVISSLLRMQADHSQDPDLIAALRDCQNRVESMALIHEQLYESDDLRAADLNRHATMLVTNLCHAYAVDPSRIKVRIAMQPVLRLGVDQAIPAGLMLNELISNALKHAFPERQAGEIVVEGALKKNEVQLSVRDNGVGLPEGFDPARAGKSLGLRIVNILARQLKGSLSFEAKARGCLFRIRFPHQVELFRREPLAQHAG
jgi:two-component sensor histidine kinase